MSKNPKSSIVGPGALNKAKRHFAKKYDAVSIKPPTVVPDPDGGDDHKYFCVFVSEEGAASKQMRLPCTLDVWKRCEGRTGAGSVRNGLDARLHNNFVMYENAEGEIYDVDILPKQYYATKAMIPERLRDKEDILIKVNPRLGSLDVSQVPAGVTKAKLASLVNTLNKLETIQSGDTLAGGFEVLYVSGTTLSIAPPTLS